MAMALHMADDINPAGEVWELRREFHSLQRRLRSGQRKLKSNVRLMNELNTKMSTSRSMKKKHRTKTSTPKVSKSHTPTSASQNRVTPKRKSSLQRHQRSQRSSAKALEPRHSSSLRQRITPKDLSSEMESAVSSSTDSNPFSVNDGSPSLKPLQRRRSERLRARSGGKENKLLRSLERRKQSLDTSTTDEPSDLRMSASPRPKSILLTPGTRIPGKTPNRVAFVDRLNQLSVKRQRVTAKDRSLLGYDWIAGVLESGSDYVTRSDEYFEELCQFRRLNREDCVHDTVSDLSTTTPMLDSRLPRRPEDEDLPSPQTTHKCIHNYHLNSRLFPVPLHEGPDGESLCAICRERKKEHPSKTSPAYIRVSVPRSTLVSPYKVKSHRRRSYDPTDSVGLSQHCLAGWQSSKPSMMPTASSIDLKSALGPTSDRSNFYPSTDDIPPTRRIPRMSRRTQELMNRTLALQLDAQKLANRNLSAARPGIDRPRTVRKSLRKKRKDAS